MRLHPAQHTSSFVLVGYVRCVGGRVLGVNAIILSFLIGPVQALAGQLHSVPGCFQIRGNNIGSRRGVAEFAELRLCQDGSGAGAEMSMRR